MKLQMKTNHRIGITGTHAIGWRAVYFSEDEANGFY